MNNSNIEVTNDVLKSLIDSQKGYEKAIEIVNHQQLSDRFRKRAIERSALVGNFQLHVRSLGGEPATDGTMSGTAHRSFMSFMSIFQNDAKAALTAIDDGEEALADGIKDKLGDEGLTPDTRRLLETALESARDGERFADRVEDLLDA